MDVTFDVFVRRRLRELNLGFGEFAEKVGLSRSGLYKVLADNRSDMMVSTLLLLARELSLHPSSLLRLLARDQKLEHQARGPSFIGDDSFPDYAMVNPHQIFTKTWLSQNNTSTIWEGCELRCIDSDLRVIRTLPDGGTKEVKIGLVPLSPSVPIPTTLPNELVELNVEFQAPETAGTVISCWKMFNHQGVEAFPEREGLTCVVRVVAL